MITYPATCNRCGKIVKYGYSGCWIGLYDKSNSPKFYCSRCLKQMEDEEYEKRTEPIRAFFKSIREEAAKRPPLKERENMEMAECLRTLCPTAGWYALRDIEKSCLTLGRQGSRSFTHILNRMGFTQRARKKRGSYMHVYIDPAKIHERRSDNA